MADGARPTELTVGASWVRLLVDALSAVGFDARAYSQLKGWNLDHPAHGAPPRLPWKDIGDLWAAAARSSGDPHLGLHAAATLPARAEGPFGYLVMSSSTLYDGLCLMIRYQALHFDGEAVSLEARGDHMAFCVSLPGDVPSSYHQIEYACTLVKRTCAWAVGPRFRLAGVRFRHPGPASVAEHERIFECPVQFRQRENALLLPRAMVSQPSLFANPEILRAVQEIAERRLAELRHPPWVAQVRRVVEPRLEVPCHVNDVASQLGISGRSLQRRLAAEGSSFDKVLDQTRRERSLQLIRSQGITVAGIAAQVGFGGSRAFVRAFQRWTGSSPSSYRAAQAGQGAGDTAPGDSAGG